MVDQRKYKNLFLLCVLTFSIVFIVGYLQENLIIAEKPNVEITEETDELEESSELEIEDINDGDYRSPTT